MKNGLEYGIRIESGMAYVMKYLIEYEMKY
jgi:hypothetical protein